MLDHVVSTANETDRARLFQVWESSVRATHHFLAEEEIQFLLPVVRAELAGMSPVQCLRAADGGVCAFMFVEEGNIEALFVAPEQSRMGAGRALVEFAVRSLGASRVDVNEQNERAVRFYEHLGFRTISRSDLDPQGRPFPVLHMSLDSCSIRLAQSDELDRLLKIEDEAGTVFAGLGLIDEARDTSFPRDDLARLIALGQVWVACPGEGIPVGMLVASVWEGAVHVEELDVVPRHGRRGLGARLLATVCAWAEARRYPAVTLSTFRDLPWNGPFYRKHGFRDLQPAEWTPGMRAIHEREVRHGLRVELRVFMRRELP